MTMLAAANAENAAGVGVISWRSVLRQPHAFVPMRYDEYSGRAPRTCVPNVACEGHHRPRRVLGAEALRCLPARLLPPRGDHHIIAQLQKVVCQGVAQPSGTPSDDDLAIGI